MRWDSRCIGLSAAALWLGGCSTHEARFEAGVPPRTPPPRTQSLGEEFRKHDLAAQKLLRLLGKATPRTSTEAVAVLARASAIGHLGQRDRLGNRADYLRRLAVSFGDELSTRATAMRDGRAYAAATGGRVDPQVTAEVGDAFVAVFRATGSARFAEEASATIAALVSGVNRWPSSGSRPHFARAAELPRFGVQAPGSRHLYDLSATATVAVLLDRASGLDISYRTTGIAPAKPAQAQIIRQRRLVTQAAGLVADQLLPLRLKRYKGAAPPPGLAELTSVISRAHGSTIPAFSSLSAYLAPVLAPMVFKPSGEPKRFALGLLSGLALNAVDLRSNTGQRVLLWAVDHVRRDGTSLLGAASDTLTQAYVALALEQRLYILAQRAPSQL